ncbi:hypothetical protein AAC387_Pa02g1912 [Persea americana]
MQSMAIWRSLLKSICGINGTCVVVNDIMLLEEPSPAVVNLGLEQEQVVLVVAVMLLELALMIHLEVEVMQLEAVPMTLLMGIKAMMLAVTADVPVAVAGLAIMLLCHFD